MGRFVHENEAFIDLAEVQGLLRCSRRQLFYLIDQRVLKPEMIELSHSKKLWFVEKDILTLAKVKTTEPALWRWRKALLRRRTELGRV